MHNKEKKNEDKTGENIFLCTLYLKKSYTIIGFTIALRFSHIHLRKQTVRSIPYLLLK